MNDKGNLNRSVSEINHDSLIIGGEKYEWISQNPEVNILPTSVGFLKNVYSRYDHRFGDYSDNVEIRALYQNSLFFFWEEQHFKPIWYKNKEGNLIFLIKNDKFSAVGFFSKNNEMKTIELGRPMSGSKFIPLIRFKQLDKDHGKKKYPKPIIIGVNL